MTSIPKTKATSVSVPFGYASNGAFIGYKNHGCGSIAETIVRKALGQTWAARCSAAFGKKTVSRLAPSGADDDNKEPQKTVKPRGMLMPKKMLTSEDAKTNSNSNSDGGTGVWADASENVMIGLTQNICFGPQSADNLLMNQTACVVHPVQPFDAVMMKNLTNPDGETENEMIDNYLKAQKQYSEVVDLCYGVSEAGGGADTGQQLSAVWRTVVNTAESTTPINEEALKEYKVQRARLRGEATKNPLTGEVDPEPFTPLFKDYLAAKDAYFDAEMAFFNSEQTYVNDPVAWSRVKPIAKARKETAMQKWIVTGKEKVERIQDEMARLSTQVTQSVISNARDVFRDGKSTTIGNDHEQPQPFYNVTPSANLFSKSFNGWSYVDYNESSDFTSSREKATKVSGSGGFRWGFVKIGGSGGSTTTTAQVNTKNKTFSISCNYAKVNLYRKWMETSWMVCPDWKQSSGAEPGSISRGSIIDNAGKSNLMLPAYPIALIVIKDLVIKTDLSETEYKECTKVVEGGGGVSFGPIFSLAAQGGSTEHSESSLSVKKDGTFTQAGPSILAVILRTPVYSSPILK